METTEIVAWIIIGVLLLLGLISFVLRIWHVTEKAIKGEDPMQDDD